MESGWKSLSADLGFPTITRKGRIASIEMKKTPIRVILSDGTSLALSWDDWRRLGKNPPRVGDEITVEFQKRIDPNGSERFQVARISIN